MRGGLFFLPEPLFEEADNHLAHGVAIPRRFGFHFAVQVVRNLKGCFHEASLLYCWVKSKREGWSSLHGALRQIEWASGRMERGIPALILAAGLGLELAHSVCIAVGWN